jgi:hypothetical protein
MSYWTKILFGFFLAIVPLLIVLTYIPSSYVENNIIFSIILKCVIMAGVLIIALTCIQGPEEKPINKITERSSD